MRTASALPVFIGEGFDLTVAECGDGVSNAGYSREMLMRVWGVLQCLPRVLVSRQIILLSLLLASTVGMRGAVV